MFNSTKYILTLQYLVMVSAVALISIVTTFVLTRTQLQQGFQATHRDLVSQEVIALGQQELTAEVFHAHEAQTLQKVMNQGWLVVGLTLLTSGGIAYILASLALRPIERTYDAQANFIADASHELKTPLTGLMTRTEVALLNHQATPNELRKVLQKNLTSIRHLHNLIVNLLELTRIELGVLRLHPQPINLDTLCTMIIEDVKSRNPRKKITVKLSVVSSQIASDQTYLRQLLTVLVENAFKYTPDQGTVEINAVKSRGKIALKITDSGIGVSKKDLPHIFKRLYKAEPSAREGLGLGLPLAAKIVKAFGGRIGITSQLGKGSCFEVLIPELAYKA